MHPAVVRFLGWQIRHIKGFPSICSLWLEEEKRKKRKNLLSLVLSRFLWQKKKKEMVVCHQYPELQNIMCFAHKLLLQGFEKHHDSHWVPITILELFSRSTPQYEEQN